MRRLTLCIVLVVAFLWRVPAARAELGFAPPVDAAIAVRFDAPEHAYGPGHRGIDYVVAAGTYVRAAADGTVAFAGRVAGHLAVTIDHERGYSTTYSSLGSVSVSAGGLVEEGTWIGRSSVAHPGGVSGLHFGVKLHGDYIDPALVLPTVDVSEAIHLAPLTWQAFPDLAGGTPAGLRAAGSVKAPCDDTTPLSDAPRLPPNDNVAVAIAGIGSSTKGGLHADMYEHGPAELGYDDVYDFSYAGHSASTLHKPYESVDTFGDIRGAARELGTLLRQVAKKHPGRKVDLIAHSMGGIVARTFLAKFAGGTQGLPQVEHLVTFSTPHRGASIAKLGRSLETGTRLGPHLLDAVSEWSRAGAPIPDPRSPAVTQLHPDSWLMGALAREDVAYGTRVLTLAIPHDLVVTADRARWEHGLARVVPPAGVQGHSAIVSSDHAQGLAYGFLRDAPEPCETGWDRWGPGIGRAIGWVEENSYWWVRLLDRVDRGRLIRSALARLF